MPSTVDRGLIDEILGGDPLLTPAEAAARLGIDEQELYDRTVKGEIGSIQPGGPDCHHRYRTSVIARAAQPPG